MSSFSHEVQKQPCINYKNSDFYYGCQVEQHEITIVAVIFKSIELAISSKYSENIRPYNLTSKCGFNDW